MLVTANIERSKDFYVEVIKATPVLELEKHIVFQEGFSLLHESDWRLFTGIGDHAVVFGHLAGQLVLEVDDIDAFWQRVQCLPDLAVMHAIKEHPWGRRAVRLYDPDGHVVEIGESMKVVVKRFLVSGMSFEDTAVKSEFPLEFVRACLEELQKDTK